MAALSAVEFIPHIRSFTMTAPCITGTESICIHTAAWEARGMENEGVIVFIIYETVVTFSWKGCWIIKGFFQQGIEPLTTCPQC